MDWDDIKVFLAVQRSGSVNAAARALRIDASTAGRRLARLEVAIGAALFDRSITGTTLTVVGERVLPEAERLEEAALAIVSVGSTDVTMVEGAVRLATTETLFSGLLQPHLRAFHKAHPQLCLELVTATVSVNLIKREADVALRPMTKRPTQLKIVAKKLSDVQYNLYASDDYLRRHGRPTSGGCGHDVVGFDPQFGAFPVSEWMDRTLQNARVAFTANTMLSRAEACASGLGLAALPHFLAIRYPALVRLEGNLPTPALWLLVHPDLRRSARVRAVLDFLTETVHAQRAVLEGD